MYNTCKEDGEGMKKARRQLANVSFIGTSQLHLRNPLIIAWWSAAFPGFGHLLLDKYLRGFLLIGWEMLINLNMNLNLAMIYTFTGKFNLAKDVLDIRWMSLYVPVYLFAIYDSYRTSIDLNHAFILAKKENAPFSSFTIGVLEINYLDKRSPGLSIIWSLLMPGIGQLYIHRIVASFYILTVWIALIYKSRFLEGIYYTMMLEFEKATKIINSEYSLFLPSLYGFALYDAYVNTVENNKLFDREQRNFVKQNYQESRFDFQCYNKN